MDGTPLCLIGEEEVSAILHGEYVLEKPEGDLSVIDLTLPTDEEKEAYVASQGYVIKREELPRGLDS